MPVAVKTAPHASPAAAAATPAAPAAPASVVLDREAGVASRLAAVLLGSRSSAALLDGETSRLWTFSPSRTRCINNIDGGGKAAIGPPATEMAAGGSGGSGGGGGGGGVFYMACYVPAKERVCFGPVVDDDDVSSATWSSFHCRAVSSLAFVPLPDRAAGMALAVGTAEGVLRLFALTGWPADAEATTSDLDRVPRIVSLRYEERPLVRIVPTNVAASASSLSADVCLVFDGGVVVVLDAVGLHSLWLARTASARAVASDAADVRTRHAISHRKYQLLGQDMVADVLPLGRAEASLFHSSLLRTTVHGFMAVGMRPAMGLYLADDEEGVFSASEIASRVTTAVSSAVWGFAKNLLPKSTAEAPGGQDGAGAGGDGEKFRLPPAKSVSLDVAFADGARRGDNASLSPDGALAAVADAYGRVLLIDVAAFLVIRIWKGYRDAQVGWIAGSRAGQYHLAIHAPKRGLLEIWRLRHGARMAASNVGPGCLLVNVETGGARADSPSAPEALPVAPRCVLLKPDGTVFNVSVYVGKGAACAPTPAAVAPGAVSQPAAPGRVTIQSILANRDGRSREARIDALLDLARDTRRADVRRFISNLFRSCGHEDDCIVAAVLERFDTAALPPADEDEDAEEDLPEWLAEQAHAARAFVDCRARYASVLVIDGADGAQLQPPSLLDFARAMTDERESKTLGGMRALLRAPADTVDEFLPLVELLFAGLVRLAPADTKGIDAVLASLANVGLGNGPDAASAFAVFFFRLPLTTIMRHSSKSSPYASFIHRIAPDGDEATMTVLYDACKLATDVHHSLVLATICQTIGDAQDESSDETASRWSTLVDNLEILVQLHDLAAKAGLPAHSVSVQAANGKRPPVRILAQVQLSLAWPRDRVLAMEQAAREPTYVDRVPPSGTGVSVELGVPLGNLLHRFRAHTSPALLAAFRAVDLVRIMVSVPDADVAAMSNAVFDELDTIGREDDHVRLGAMHRMFEWHAATPHRHAVKLLDKVGKAPKDRLCRKNVPMSLDNLVPFVAFCADLAERIWAWPNELGDGEENGDGEANEAKKKEESAPAAAEAGDEPHFALMLDAAGARSTTLAVREQHVIDEQTNVSTAWLIATSSILSVVLGEHGARFRVTKPRVLDATQALRSLHSASGPGPAKDACREIVNLGKQLVVFDHAAVLHMIRHPALRIDGALVEETWCEVVLALYDKGRDKMADDALRNVDKLRPLAAAHMLTVARRRLAVILRSLKADPDYHYILSLINPGTMEQVLTATEGDSETLPDGTPRAQPSLAATQKLLSRAHGLVGQKDPIGAPINLMLQCATTLLEELRK